MLLLLTTIPYYPRPHTETMWQFSRDYIGQKRIEEIEQAVQAQQTEQTQQVEPTIKPITLPNVAEFMKARGVDLPVVSPVTPLELPVEDDDDILLAWFMLSNRYGKIITD